MYLYINTLNFENIKLLVLMFSEADNQLVKLADLISAKIEDLDDRNARKLRERNGTVELVPVGTANRFFVWTVRRVGQHRWRHHKILFQSNDSNVVSEWVDKINEIIARQGMFV